MHRHDQNMSAANDAATFDDTSVDCAICLEPLEAEQFITLSCGHKWHLGCVREQLRLAEPDLSKPLLFTGYRCAKCARFCQHPLLDETTRAVSHLRDKVDRLMLQQAQVDSLHLDEAVSDEKGAFHGQLLEYARRVYAFYMCSICSNPYFGGTLQCAERVPTLATQDRMCPRCSPRTSSTCTDTTHTPFYIWKCRFCCNAAIFVCYGSTHLCARCHHEDDGRAQRANIVTKPCNGRPECTQPLPNGKDFHENGASKNCEQLYHCAACESEESAPEAVTRVPNFERGSRNLIFNRSGEHGLHGWYQLERTPWGIEQSEVPLFNSRTNFVSSWTWSRMFQVVDLRRFVRDPSQAMIEFSARFMARTDCPSTFQLEAAIYNTRAQELRYMSMDEPKDAPADYWDIARLVSPPTEDACFAVLIVSGKDKRFWAGLFGSKVAECSVRVVLEDSTVEENEVLLEAALVGAEEVSAPQKVQSRRIRRALIQTRGRGFRPLYY